MQRLFHTLTLLVLGLFLHAQNGPIEDGTYELVSLSTGEVAVAGSEIYDQEFDGNYIAGLPQINVSGTADYWLLRNDGNGFYTIESVRHTGDLLTSPDQPTADEPNDRYAVTGPASGMDNQLWSVTMASMGNFQIVNKATGLALKLSDEPYRPATAFTYITLAPNDGSDILQWSFNPVTVDLRGLRVVQASAQLFFNQQLQLQLIAEPVFADFEVEWISSDPSVATVDDNGLVTAGSTAGRVSIFAVSGDEVAVSQIDVSELLTSFSGVYQIINPEANKALTASSALYDREVSGHTTVLFRTERATNSIQRWVIEPTGNGDYTLQTERNYANEEWLGRTDSITSENPDGKIAATWPLGNTPRQRWRIEEVSQGIFRIINQDNNKALNTTTIPFKPGNNGAQAIGTYPIADDPDQYWTINPVDNLPPGTVDLRKATFDQSPIEIEIGTSKTPTLTLTPSNASIPFALWVSSDESVATVDQNGTVTATGKGWADITVVYANGTRASLAVAGKNADEIGVQFGSITVTAEAGERQVFKGFGVGFSQGFTITDYPFPEQHEELEKMLYEDLNTKWVKFYSANGFEDRFVEKRLESGELERALAQGVEQVYIAPGFAFDLDLLNNPDNLTGFADLVQTVTQDYGLPVDYTALANEYTGSLGADGLKRAARGLLRELAARNITDTEVVLGDAASADDFWANRYDIVRADTSLWDSLAGFTTHTYNMGANIRWSQFQDNETKDYFQTEAGFGNGASAVSRYFSDITNRVNYWAWFLGILPEDNNEMENLNRLIALEKPGGVFSGEYYALPKYYYLRHVNRVLQPGAKPRFMTTDTDLAETREQLTWTFGRKPPINVAVFENPDGSWGLGASNNTRLQRGNSIVSFYDSTDYKITFVVEELVDLGTIEFELVRTTPDLSKNYTSEGTLTMVNGRITVPSLAPGDLITLISAPNLVADVELNKTVIELPVGATEQLLAVDESANITPAYTSGDESVATVDAAGNVTAVGCGNTLITATRGESTTSALVVVGLDATMTINQKVRGGQWNDVGTFNFKSGVTDHVTIRTDGTRGFVVADAVRFSRDGFEDIIVDNDDELRVFVEGNWSISTSSDSKFGDDYLHNRKNGQGSKEVVYTPMLPESGEWTVSMYWPAAGNRDRNVPIDIYATGDKHPNAEGSLTSPTYGSLYVEGTTVQLTTDVTEAKRVEFLSGNEVLTIDTEAPYEFDVDTLVPGYHQFHANVVLPNDSIYVTDARIVRVVNPDSGTDEIIVNERINAGRYNVLGTFDFSDDGTNFVRIRTDRANGYVIADAIKFSRPGQPDIILDSENATDPGISIIGNWVTSSAAPGFEGASYLHDQRRGQGNKSIVYTPSFPEAGEWTVSMIWSSYRNRASNVHVDIYATGSAIGTVNAAASSGAPTNLPTAKSREPLPLDQSNVIGIFPNPVSRELVVTGFDYERAEKIMIFDTGGRLVRELPILQGSDRLTIDVAELNPGLHLLLVISDDTIQQAKFLKN